MRGLAVMVFLGLAACSPPAHSVELEELNISATPVAMTRDGDETTRGRLRYLGGFELNSDNPWFGGLSAIRFMADDETLLAITDRGQWLTLETQFEGDRFASVSGGWMRAMLSRQGEFLEYPFSDSESLVLTEAHAIVGFEGRHRIDRYDLPWGDTNPAASQHVRRADLGELANNGGVEGLTLLTDGSLLAGIEDPDDTGELRLVRFGTDRSVQNMHLDRDGAFKITDLATLPGGDVLVLERRFSILGGVGAQIRRVDPETIDDGALIDAAPVAEFGPGDTIDNMEGLAVRVREGRTELFIVSDNNFNAVQRTLLLAFELVGE